jgi:S1-C subfamily serine protease
VNNKVCKIYTKRILFALAIAIPSILLLMQAEINKSSDILKNDTNALLKAEPEHDSANKKRDMLKPAVKLSMINLDSRISGIPSSNWEVIGSATGVSIGYDKGKNLSYILTNNHFCEDVFLSSLMAIILEDSSSPRINAPLEDATIASILRTSGKSDLCLLGMTGYIKPATLANDEVIVDQFDKIYIIGGPTGIFPTILETFVSGHLSRDQVSLPNLSRNGDDFIFISGMILPGHSGSPVYNKNNEMIGLVFATVPSYGALAISINDIYNFIEE